MSSSLSLKILARLPLWTQPRIGRLRQHRPKPLRIPARYLRTRAPRHAPTITIVTPSYEHGRFIERTIYSVVSQQYPALEYVVQDGRSLDETLDVLRRYDHLLSHWTSEADSGQADAINRGFRDTRGDLMAWLNSDDLLLPGALAYIACHFADHPDTDVVYGHRLMIDENDGEIGAWILPRHDDVALTLLDYVPQETLFWRRRIWERVGARVDPSFGYAIDWDLLLRFLDAGAKIVRLPRFLGAFRVHGEQKTTASDRIGSSERTRLRTRVHGRDLPREEVAGRMGPYLVRHLLTHARHRVVGLVMPQFTVRTIPSDPALHTPAATTDRMAPADGQLVEDR